MTTRREVLQAGMAAWAWSLTSSAEGVLAASGNSGASGRPLGRIPLERIVFDHQYQESVAFAAEARALGCPTHGIRGDVTGLWCEHLSVLWKSAPAPVAGLTDEPALFCLERLAWDYRMRVVYHAIHDRRSTGVVTPEVTWPRELARTLAHQSPGSLRIGEAPSFVMGMTAVPEGDPEPLVSWIIAPRDLAQGILVASL